MNYINFFVNFLSVGNIWIDMDDTDQPMIDNNPNVDISVTEGINMESES